LITAAILHVKAPAPRLTCLEVAMDRPALTMQDCWAAGGRLRLEVAADGRRIHVSGNREGFVGLARVLLWHVQHGDGAADLGELAGFEDGSPVLELGAPE
jgi:hypothetical protein